MYACMYVCMYVCSSITLERLEQFQPNLVYILLYVYIKIIFLYYIYIYIYKNECLYVCLSRMRSYTIHPIATKLRGVVVRTPGKVYELLFSS
jgi:hypothetical protein